MADIFQLHLIDLRLVLKERGRRNGPKSPPNRPNSQTHRRRRASLAIAARRTSAGKQRREINGLLQSTPTPLHPLHPPPSNALQEFNARTATYVPGTPIPARVTVRPDRSFTFELRTPPTSSLLLSAAGVAPIKGKLRGAGNTPGPSSKLGAEGKGKAANPSGQPGNAGVGYVGTVSLKHVYEIAKIKRAETRLSGIGLEAMVRSVVSQAGSMGVQIVP